jgi:hypothetical protein
VSPIEQAHLDKLAKRVNEIDAAIEQQFGVIAGVEGIAAGSTARRETAEGGVRDLEGRITRNRGTIGGLRERQQDLIGERDLIRAQGPAREQMRRASASRTEMAADNAAVEEARRWFDAYKALNDTMAATFQAMIASAGMTKAQIDNEMRKLGEKFDARVSQIESQNRNGGTGAR